MWFNSWEFAIYLPVVLLTYYALNHRAQNIWLIIASYVFYGFWDWRFLALIAFSTLIDFFAAQQISDSKTKTRKKAFLLLSLSVNLGALATFKYFNFFVDSFIEFGALFGLNFDTPVMRLLPPIGISFYTFQTLAYSIDVYRGKMEPSRKITDFALYVCYFPQLVAGPIERAQRLLPQIAKKRNVSQAMITSGCFLILVGLFKKIVIADNAGIHADKIFSDPSGATSLQLWAGMILFSIQIYGDFSGYSNIARGVSRLFGIELIENFQTPYFSRNITEFWRRWHISLSSWLKDYLYIPLGGNRHGKYKTYRNLMLTMIIGGLWHGAAWTFVVWGSLHGLYLAVHKLWVNSNLSQWCHNKSIVPHWVSWSLGVILTFHLVAFTWIFFRADSFQLAWLYITNMLSFQGAIRLRDVFVPALLILALLPIEIIQYRKTDIFSFLKLPFIVRTVAYSGMIFALIIWSGNDVPFIYFQF